MPRRDEDDDVNGAIGTFTPVAGGVPDPVFAPLLGGKSSENEFFVARAKLNFKFGTY